MTSDETILYRRLPVTRLAQALGEDAAACREAGISRTAFYRWRRRFHRYGPNGLHPRRTRGRRGRLRRARLPRYVLHREAEGGRERGVDQRLGRRLLLRGRPDPPRVVGLGHGGLEGRVAGGLPPAV